MQALNALNGLREPLLGGNYDGDSQQPPAPAPPLPPLAVRALADPEAPDGQQLAEDNKLRRRELTGLMFNALVGGAQARCHAVQARLSSAMLSQDAHRLP
jgi:hypothetical protein